jgi:hypothetical protein
MEGENDVGRGLDLPSVSSRSVSTMLWVGVGVDDINVDDAGSEEQLKFHCYEAHIPYTMQFFQIGIWRACPTCTVETEFSSVIPF